MSRNRTANLPAWVAHTLSVELRVAAEDAYGALDLAVAAGADEHTRCTRLMARGRELLQQMEDAGRSDADRAKAGREAAAQFGAARLMLGGPNTPPFGVS